MKPQLGNLLIVFSLLFILSGLSYKFLQEKSEYKNTLTRQRDSIEQGLKKRWRDYLLERVRNEQLVEGYRLFFFRNGRRLAGEFFPRHSSVLRWKHYRNNYDDTLKSKAFLHHAFSLKNSWDRVLAIKEYIRRFQIIPKLSFTQYEKTLFNEEIAIAYKKLFKLFDGNKNFTFIGRTYQFDGVFYRLTSKGLIEAFYPEKEIIFKREMVSFLKGRHVKTGKLGQSINSVKFDGIHINKNNNPFFIFYIILISIGLLIIGLILNYRSIIKQKKELLKKVSFLDQVVHEIKTPLAGLKLHTQLLQSDDEDNESYKSIIGSVDRVDALFNDIVLMNRKREKVKLNLLDRKTFEQEIIVPFKQEFLETLEVDSIPECSFYSEVPSLKLILRNLVNNAIKYGEFSTISFFEEKGSFIISVKDNGEGISKEDAPKIFDEYYRSEKMKNKKIDGLGMGLAIAKKIAREISCELSFENPGEPGALFKLKFKKL